MQQGTVAALRLTHTPFLPRVSPVRMCEVPGSLAWIRRIKKVYAPAF